MIRVGNGKLVISTASHKKPEQKLRQALFCLDGQWFLGSMTHPEAQCSMLEALDQAMNGGITIHDMSYMLPGLGITLADCAKDNLAATESFIYRKCTREFAQMKHYGHHYDQTVRELQKFHDDVSEFRELQLVIADAIKDMKTLPKSE